MEIQKDPKSAAARAKTSEKLRLVLRDDSIHTLQLDDDASRDGQVSAERRRDNGIFVDQGKRVLHLHPKPAASGFVG